MFLQPTANPTELPTYDSSIPMVSQDVEEQDEITSGPSARTRVSMSTRSITQEVLLQMTDISSMSTVQSLLKVYHQGNSHCNFCVIMQMQCWMENWQTRGVSSLDRENQVPKDMRGFVWKRNRKISSRNARQSIRQRHNIFCSQKPSPKRQVKCYDLWENCMR